jgi:signal transduction histidine kinase
MFLNTLSGRYLLLTTAFVMLAEVLIFVPSVARFRVDYLLSRLERAQIASLALLAEEMISPELEQELLDNAEVLNVVLRRDAVRQLVLSSPIPGPVDGTFDLRDAPPLELMRDALVRLFDPQDRIIRLIGDPVRQGGMEIEVTMHSSGLRQAMIDYGLRILLLSFVISAITAVMLFLAVRRFLVKPIEGVIGYMTSYADHPEDARRIIQPSAGLVELRQAEEALQSLQTHVTAALRQKERLAQLGAAVAKISHDLRNILTTAQLFADRMEDSADPAVQRAVPKLVSSIRRAVSLCESTLAFGKAEEAPPALQRVPLQQVVEDVLGAERLAAEESGIELSTDFPANMVLRCDPEQLYRVLANLVGNARQAIAATGKSGRVTLMATESDSAWCICVKDTGPGLPPKAREHLFMPFQGGTRKEGSGLGLAIAAELVAGHGGRLELEETGSEGTTFRVTLPKGAATQEILLERNYS